MSKRNTEDTGQDDVLNEYREKSFLHSFFLLFDDIYKVPDIVEFLMLVI